MSATVVRYRVNPEYAETNAERVRAVYAALDRDQPEGFSYATFRLEDGVSFVHVATHEEGANPLLALAEFAAFREGLAGNCEVPPAASSATAVGSYGLQT